MVEAKCNACGVRIEDINDPACLGMCAGTVGNWQESVHLCPDCFETQYGGDLLNVFRDKCEDWEFQPSEVLDSTSAVCLGTWVDGDYCQACSASESIDSPLRKLK